MTKPPSYRYPNRRPIRKDRVAMAALLLLAIILTPLIMRSGCSREGEPLVVVDGSGTTQTPPDTSTNSGAPQTPGASSGTDQPARTERFLTHTVADGETVSSIASSMRVTVSNLRASNRLFGNEQLQPNRVLYASPEGIVHTIKSGQTLSDIARSYAVPLETLLQANGLTASATIFAGDRLLVPGVTTSFWNDAVTLSKGVSSQFIWPLEGEVVSVFGPRIHPVLRTAEQHDGIDIDVPIGTTVHAAAGGEVFFYGEQPGYGNVLIIQHPSGFYSLYGHLSSSFVFAGQYVEMGQAVAQSGNTGVSSGPHLHFEIRNREYPIDPERYLP